MGIWRWRGCEASRGAAWRGARVPLRGERNGEDGAPRGRPTRFHMRKRVPHPAQAFYIFRGLGGMGCSFAEGEAAGRPRRRLLRCNKKDAPTLRSAPVKLCYILFMAIQPMLPRYP